MRRSKYSTEREHTRTHRERQKGDKYLKRKELTIMMMLMRLYSPRQGTSEARCSYRQTWSLLRIAGAPRRRRRQRRTGCWPKNPGAAVQRHLSSRLSPWWPRTMCPRTVRLAHSRRGAYTASDFFVDQGYSHEIFWRKRGKIVIVLLSTQNFRTIEPENHFLRIEHWNRFHITRLGDNVWGNYIEK